MSYLDLASIPAGAEGSYVRPFIALSLKSTCRSQQVVQPHPANKDSIEPADGVADTTHGTWGKFTARASAKEVSLKLLPCV